MQRVLRFLLIIYQVCIALPILIVLTTLAALLSVLLSPWADTAVGALPARIWARLFCWILWVRVKVIGREHIQQGQSYVVAANHQSFFDIWAIYGWLPIKFKWVMKSTLRKIPLVGWACEKVGHIFLNRESSIAAKNSLQRAERTLRNGISVVIFPEGTRSSDGSLGSFKRGAFMLATDLRLPVLPVSLTGCYERMPRGTLHITPGVIQLRIHPPVDIQPYGHDDQRQLAEHVRQIIGQSVDNKSSLTHD
ncbi:MAG: 1-acyl-sn-glycerol-3-phosphate acyltransferase [Paludibacteraceae bacterium]|nr:1-acyl-sn-glycerol-3-phosphate acyltransferase [Paludibacteraceae bacterium]